MKSKFCVKYSPCEIQTIKMFVFKWKVVLAGLVKNHVFSELVLIQFIIQQSLQIVESAGELGSST